MSLETELFAVLKGLVSNRVYPLTFVQPSGSLPVWPAIRYTLVSVVPEEDLCGDGDDETATARVQLDVVDKTYAGARALRLSVMSAMRAFIYPARLAASADTYDDETKTHRVILDYTIHGSSDTSMDSPA